MSDDRPTRPSRPRVSVPAVFTAPNTKPFALLSNTMSAVERIVRPHVEQAASFTVTSAPLTIVAAREADLVRLLVRVVADAALTLPVPRTDEAAILLTVRRDPRDAVVIVEVIGEKRPTDSHTTDEVAPTLETLAFTASATIELEHENARARRIALRIPLAVPLEATNDSDPV